MTLGLASTWHIVIFTKVYGKQKGRCPWSRLGRALEETVYSHIRLYHLLSESGLIRELL